MNSPTGILAAARWLAAALALLALFACGPAQTPDAGAPPSATPSAATVPPTSALTVAAPTTAAVTPFPSPTEAPTPADAAAALPPPPPPAGDAVQIRDAAVAEQARRKYEGLLRAAWATDFTRATIDYDEIMTGGPPKDGIPSIDRPLFESIADADAWLDDLEPVQVVDLNGDARAYPVQVMVWHELVNDVVGGDPVVITF